MIREIPWRDPADIFARIGGSPGRSFLDSAATGDPRSQASYIGIDPIDEVRLEQASMREIATVLRRMRRADAPVASPLPFAGGLIGMLSYDAAARSLAGCAMTDSGLPDLIVRRYGILLGFDLDTKRAWARIDPQIDSRRIEALLSREPAPASTAPVQWREETSEAAHRAKVEAVLRYIAAGDIYQANITTRFHADRPEGFDATSAYLALRSRSPAPFGAFIDLGGGSVLMSASPERFVTCDRAGAIETRPIKGTLPRSSDPRQDRLNGETLAASEKDRAENLMICDLLRNDLSIVAETGSVAVTELAELEGFASVWHLVSAVQARLAEGRDAIDLLEAACPGGSITGAPKTRATEIIAEIEDSPRGPFYGIVFRLGDDGALDSSIIIRSVIATPTHLIAAAGGGIVADSDAASEYAELRAKIDPILEAFGRKP